MNNSPLSPSPSFWRIDLINQRHDCLVLHLEPVRNSASCPVCHTPSNRVHSYYWRIPRDLPWAGWSVRLVVHSRRFFCDQKECPQRIFTERFPGVLARYSYQTERLRVALLEMAHASSAEMASRVGRIIGYQSSGDSLIRKQRREPLLLSSPRVLGVDEFAFRRGTTYGTLLVDLERRRPVDILDNHNTESLARWLTAHPGVEVLARDRDGAFAAAGRAAIPDALQVADRFHLVHNVGDALKELLHSHRWQRPTAPTTPEKQLTANVEEATLPDSRRPTPRKQRLWEIVKEGQKAGKSISAIAQDAGIERKTVRR